MENFTLNDAREIASRLTANVEKVIVGKNKIVKSGVMALLCRGHVLIEGVPGVGKTMLARSIAVSIGGTFKRIQCTSDLLPSDVTGTYVFDQRDREFHFRPGPIMANLVVVDEINRASPRTQSAFLESMEERQVTVDGTTHPLPNPFFILATRNPIEHGGTFPLPETELDRFIMRVRLSYPTVGDEVAIVENQMLAHPITTLGKVVDLDEIVKAQEAVRRVYMDRLVTDYAVAIVSATRQHPLIHLGASPRATLSLVALAQANALVEGRDFVLPDDIKAVAAEALSHRVILNAEGRAGGGEDQVVENVLSTVPVERTAAAQRTPFPTARAAS